MAGKAQKSANQLQNPRGGRLERRTFPVAVPDEALKAPRAPRGLGAAGRAIWDAYFTDPVSLASTRVDGVDIARFCRLHDRREALEAMIAAEGDVTEGINGPILNPRHRVLKEVTREVEKYREQLGILPLSRMRLGLVKTQRDLGVADLRRRLDRSEEAREALDAGAIEGAVVNLDELA